MTAPHADRDPLRMTPGEKLAAEWEARHDARARGAQGNPAAVQDYLRHVRTEEQPHRAAHSPAAPPPPAASTAEEPPTASRLRRLFRRR